MYVENTDDAGHDSDETELNDSPLSRKAAGYPLSTDADGNYDASPPIMKKHMLHNTAAPGSSGNLNGAHTGVDRLRQCFGPSPLIVLTLNKDHLLDTTFKRFTYNIVVFCARCIPAVWIYGGTVGLAVCIIFKYRWGVLFSLCLYSTYTLFMLTNILVNSMVGVFKVWSNTNKHWHAMANKELEMRPMRNADGMIKVGSNQSLNSMGGLNNTPPKPSGLSPVSSSHALHALGGNYSESSQLTAEELSNPCWEDVFHVVIIAAYKTPEDCLKSTVELLTQYSQAATHMGIVLGMEQREEGAQEKAERIKEYFGDRFRFVTATFHPSNMPNHIKGKASNMCWAFQEITSELCQFHGFTDADKYRIIITNMDDDSEMHENYFEALTYRFLKAEVDRRYLTIWQPPVAHFKNLATQPGVMRVGSLMGSIADLARHANPMDCHTPFSSNSMSLVLALAVGGWDPDWVSDDWHMMAKCTVMTEGRCRCEPIMLPMVNLMPEEDDCCGTIRARWTQVKRHALGVSEVVYLTSSLFLGLMEVNSFTRAVRMMWRTMPLLAKFIEIHFCSALSCIWPVVSLIMVMNSRMYWEPDIAEDQVVFNSILAHYQTLISPLMGLIIVVIVTVAVVYFNMLKHRVHNNQSIFVRFGVLFWLRAEIETLSMGWLQQVIFGSIPEWIAATRIIFQLKIDHAVAAMIGRPDMGEGF